MPAYHFSGIVVDDNGPIANTEVTLESFFSGHTQATTSTNIDGHYEIVFEATTAPGFVSLIHAGGGEYDRLANRELANRESELALRNQICNSQREDAATI